MLEARELSKCLSAKHLTTLRYFAIKKKALCLNEIWRSLLIALVFQEELQVEQLAISTSLFNHSCVSF